MSVFDQYMEFKTEEGLNPCRFWDRVRLQIFLRQRLEALWAEHGSFANGGLFLNDMTGYALGFAYYDCQPTVFCQSHCYGLHTAGQFDFRMFVLAVKTSESLKTGDPRYLEPLRKQMNGLRHLKIGHWGDATLEQVPVITDLLRDYPSVKAWWYTRKQDVALSANQAGLPNLWALLSLDPHTPYPSAQEYPFGFTYLFSRDVRHPEHERILHDPRLTTIFLVKRGKRTDDPAACGVADNTKLCEQVVQIATTGEVAPYVCLDCHGRCCAPPAKSSLRRRTK